MYGAIAGDIIGSIYEKSNHKSIEFPLFSAKSSFTDDTVLTVAVADCLLYGQNYEFFIRDWANKYPFSGYGGRFKAWMRGEIKGAYNSWGNGSAMRVSPVAWGYETVEKVMEVAKETADVTHNHPEGVKGAQAVAMAVFMARKESSKAEIKWYIQHHFGYDLERTIDEIRPVYKFDVSCQGSVPEAIIAFLEGDNFEKVIRKAISIGGDSDTIASIAGAISEAYWKGVPEPILLECKKRLPSDMLKVVNVFYEKYIN